MADDLLGTACDAVRPGLTHPDESLATLHPLFVDGLPTDFRTNPVLLAIAAPLVAGGQHGSSAIHPSRLPNGSGPVRMKTLREQRLRRQRQAAPFSKNDRHPPPAASAADKSVDELSLFMTLWKPK